MQMNRYIIALCLLLSLSLGVSTFVINSAARDAAVAARRAQYSVETHRIDSERRIDGLAKFISCALLILPEDRNAVELEKCWVQRR